MDLRDRMGRPAHVHRAKPGPGRRGDGGLYDNPVLQAIVGEVILRRYALSAALVT